MIPSKDEICARSSAPCDPPASSADGNANADLSIMKTYRAIIRSVLANWIGRLCWVIVAFCITPIVVGGLGGELYGIWSIVMALTSYYALADLGLRGAGVRCIARFHAVNDDTAVNKVVVTSLGLYFVLSVLVFAIGLVTAWRFPYFFSISEASVSTCRIVLVIASLTVSARLCTQIFGSALSALNRFDISNTINIIVQLLQAVGIFLVFRLGWGMVGLSLVNFMGTAISQLIQVAIVLRLLPHLSLSFRYFDRATLKTQMQFGGANFLSNLARRLTQYVGSLLVGYFSGPLAVAFYAIPETLIRSAEAVGMGVSSVVQPYASQLYAQKQIDTLRGLLITVPRVLAAISLTFAALAYALGTPFISLWVGENYAQNCRPMLLVLSAAMVLNLSGNPLMEMLYSIGRLKVLMHVAILSMAMTLILGCAFASGFGPTGMAWAVLTTQFVTSVVILPYATCRELEYRLVEYFVRVYLPPSLAILPALGLALAFAQYAPVTTLWALVIQIAIVCMLATICIILICFGPTARRQLLRAFAPRKLQREEL